MSTEKILKNKTDDSSIYGTSEVNEKKTSGRVDINHLIARARHKEQKEKNQSLIAFSSVVIVFIVIGIFLSL